MGKDERLEKKIKKLARKIELKDASGIDSTNDFCELVEATCEFCSGDTRTAEERDEMMLKYYFQAFNVILPAEPDKILLDCANRIESVTDEVNEILDKSGFSNEGISNLIECERKLHIIWDIVMLRAADMIPNKDDTSYLSYGNEEFFSYTTPMQMSLLEKLDTSQPGCGMTEEEWLDYFAQEIKTYRFTAKLLRESVQEKALYDLACISLTTGFVFFFRTTEMALTYLPILKGGFK